MAFQNLARDIDDNTHWDIVFAQPEFQPLHEVGSGRMIQQAYIQQGYIAQGLQSRGHRLTYLAPLGLGSVICTTDTRTSTPVTPTWSGSKWFDLAAKGSWRLQRLLGIPYLNIFFNLRLYDASIQCLSGHDVVLERHGLYRTAVALACKHLHIPYVLFFDADQIYEQDFLGKPIRGILRWRARQSTLHCLRQAQRIICPSKVIKEQLVNQWGIADKKVTVLPNAVDVERHRPYPELRHQVRSSLGLDNDAPTLIFVGRFYRWHDTETLLQAYSIVRNTVPELRLIMVGDGDRYGEARRCAERLGIADGVCFTGSITNDRVPHVVGASDIAVAPYPEMQDEFWGSPMKLFEYMASGIAIVASDVGQIGDVIDHGVNGLLTPPGDTQALATALKCLIADPDLRSRIGWHARQDAVAGHSWDRYVASVEGVLAAAIVDVAGQGSRWD